MSSLKQTEFTSKAFGSGDTSVVSDALSTTVVMANTFIIPMYTVDNNVMSQAIIKGQLTSTTQVTWSKEAAGGTPTGAAWVVEMNASGVRIERGTSLGTGSEGSRDITLSTNFDLSKTFHIAAVTNGGSTYGLDDNVQTYLFDDAGTKKLRIEDNGSGNTSDRDVEWQVIELDDCSVQRGTDTGMASGDTSEVAAITAVTLNRSFLNASFTMGDDSGNQMQEMLLSARFNSTTEIQFERDGSGVAADDIRFEVVQLSSDWRTQEVESAFASADADNDVTVTAVDTSKSFILGNMRNNMGNSNFSTDDHIGEGMFIADITSTTNVNITRGRSGESADFVGHLIEYIPPASGGLLSKMVAHDHFAGGVAV